MKNLLLVFSLLLNGTAFAGTSFYCQASKKAPYYDSETHYEATFTKTQMKLESIRYNTVAHERTVDTYLFKTNGAIQDGNNAVNGFMIYNGRIPTGDGADIQTIFVSPELRDGGKLMSNGKRGGVIKYIGYAYSYETYYCFAK